MIRSITHFLNDDSGAVTTDYVVLVGASIALTVSMVDVAFNGVETTSFQIADLLNSDDIMITSFASADGAAASGDPFGPETASEDGSTNGAGASNSSAPSGGNGNGNGNGGPQGNNGFGNGDQDAPGNSGPNNNAENAAPGSTAPGNSGNNGNNGNNGNGKKG